MSLVRRQNDPDALQRLDPVCWRRNGVMRKGYRVLLFAALVAGFMAPVGFALSLESAPWIGQAFHPVGAPSALQGFDAAGLLLVGTGLFGLAAVVRKTI
jgi:hypothetical protein